MLAFRTVDQDPKVHGLWFGYFWSQADQLISCRAFDRAATTCRRCETLEWCDYKARSLTEEIDRLCHWGESRIKLAVAHENRVVSAPMVATRETRNQCMRGQNPFMKSVLNPSPVTEIFCPAK